MERALAHVLLFALALSQLVWAQDVGNPVPSSLVDADTLTVSNQNFSISAPFVGWKWTQKDLRVSDGVKSTAFIACSPDQEHCYSVIVRDVRSGQFQQSEGEALLRGMGKTVPEGWKPLEIKVAASDEPVPRSAVFTARVRLPDDSDLFQHGYIVPGRRTYLLVTWSSDPNPPEAFVRFAGSFRFLDRHEAPYHPTSEFVSRHIWPILTAYLLVLIATMIGDIVQLRRQIVSKRLARATVGDSEVVVVSPVGQPAPLENWSQVLLAVGCGANIMSGWMLSVGRDSTYTSGAIMGAFIWPFGIAYLIHGRKRVRNWNRFARLFFWLSVFNPGILGRGGKS